MPCHIHHVHLFASDVEQSIQFYTTLFDGKVVLDAELAGARNVFIQVGSGRLHLYAQPPKRPGRGSIHHFGIRTDDIEQTVTEFKARGVEFTEPISDQGYGLVTRFKVPGDFTLQLYQPRYEKRFDAQ